MLLIVIFLTIAVTLTAQNSEGRIIYKRILNTDTLSNIKDTIGIFSVLYFNDKKTLYVFCREGDTIYDDPLDYTHKEVKTMPSQGVVRSIIQDKEGFMYYKNLDSMNFTVREFQTKRKSYIHIEPIPRIAWRIHHKLKKIGSFNCQMATTRFRGRDYTAWFTPEIPVSTGPWKFQGLPGAILEVADANKEVQFIFQAVEIPFDTDDVIRPPQIGTQISFEASKTVLQKDAEEIIKKIESSAEKGVQLSLRLRGRPIELEYEQ